MSPRGKALLVFGVMVGLTALALWRQGGPPAAPADAPAPSFSATRAIATLHEVLVDAPHPVGSPAHDVVRDRVAAAFRALGYTVDVQHAFACSTAVCGDVDNIVATLPGAATGTRQVVVTAHYDSVPAGPGASDDGTGVATALEIARAIRHDRFANPVVFLVDDGEEAGLLGAESFVADPDRSKRAALFINLEARGTSGTPFLFETSADNRWLIPIVARALPRPVTTSLFATIYEQLPNDTDLTVFKRAGRAGINFAYLGDGTQYHTPLDSFANVDDRSVQWRGEQALAMVRAFGNADLETDPAGDAVWFDVYSTFVVWWPASWTGAIAGLGVVLLAIAIAVGRRRGALTLAGVALGLASFLGSIALALGAGSLLARLLRLRAAGAPFEPHPEPMVAAAWLVGIAAAIAVAALARRLSFKVSFKVSFDALFAGHAVGWNAFAVAVTVVLPGAAYVAVVPGLVMSGVALLRARGRGSEELVTIASLVAAAAVLFPFGLAAHDSLGAASVPVVATILALISTTVSPMLTARRLVPIVCAAVVVLGAIALAMPRASASHPHHLSLAHVTDGDTGTARWQTQAPPPRVRAAARFERKSVAPWYGPYGEGDVAPAPAVAIAAPTAAVTKAQLDGKHVTTLEVSSPRRAPRLAIAWRSEAEPESIRVNGVALPPRPRRSRSYLAPGWHRVRILGSTARIEIVTRTAAPAEAIIVDGSFGLPAVAAPLITARDASGAVPVHDGDMTYVERRVTW